MTKAYRSEVENQPCCKPILYSDATYICFLTTRKYHYYKCNILISYYYTCKTKNQLKQLFCLQAHEFIHTTGDTHVYLNHIEPLKIQIQREPKDFPTVEFARKIESIDDFKVEDIIVKDYKCHPKINMEMAV